MIKKEEKVRDLQRKLFVFFGWKESETDSFSCAWFQEEKKRRIDLGPIRLLSLPLVN